MAHENLKFKLNLKDKTNFQPILGSQDYGTFYMVYIKIKKFEEFDNSDNFRQYNYHCDFKLQNFIGDITIGFGNSSPKIEFSTQSNSDDHIDAYINFSITPFDTNTEISKVIELHKKLESGMILDSNYSRTPPNQNIYDPKKPEKSKYLNPYRFIRDGEDYVEISGRKFGTDEPFPIPDSMGEPVGFCVPKRILIE
ncbi:hypothetical protein [Tenacibaculum jejuense]|uniref:Uncharacterized protein n=1 Tax=Tenacibaculum jejuense TaxID=584609 RepID=A0A238U8W9_9FLAO|nr:hypothetical protein [Tenacibaculum jejuense]SNR15631.1 protein of unknown function [Tenacibaculum jejuense]